MSDQKSTDNTDLPDKSLPNSVLFVCNHNAIRSPMAECLAKNLCGNNIYIDSFGVNEKLSAINPFCISVIEEAGLDISNHTAKHFDDLIDTSFDLIIALTPEAHKKALEITKSLTADIEYWPLSDPSETNGNRENIMSAFRAVRDDLHEKIKKRLCPTGE
ncbi:MAG: arsenate reductase ArsC [Emcibacteraceae bacterium]|nr:arsenate reductase ArsC [Emcibacteraceae bacterium]